MTDADEVTDTDQGTDAAASTSRPAKQADGLGVLRPMSCRRFMLAYSRGPPFGAGCGHRSRRGCAGAWRVLPGHRLRGVSAAATLAAGDVAAADDAIAAGNPHLGLQPERRRSGLLRGPGCAGARGSHRGPALGRRSGRSDSGLHLSLALTTRAGVAIAQGEPEQADRDAHDALATAASTRAYGQRSRNSRVPRRTRRRRRQSP